LRIAPWIASGVLVLLIGAVAAAFLPGVAMYDTVAQYGEVLSNRVDDWHPPIMVRLWQLFHGIAPTTMPMFALQVVLYAVGFALISAALVRIDRPRAAIATVILALSPLLLGWQMVVLKDAQMLAALLAACGNIAHFRLSNRKMSVVAVAVTVLLICYATFVRGNALFATVPLAVMLLPTRRRPLVSSALVVIGFAVVLAVTPIVNHRLLRAQPSDVAKTQPIFDLAAIAVQTGPGSESVFSRTERDRIAARHCVKAFFWDPLGDPGGCASVTDRFMEQPVGTLYLELAKTAAQHPIAYARHRLAHWNSTQRWLVAPGLPDIKPPSEAEPNDVGLAAPNGNFASSWQDAAGIEASTPIGWPIVWTVVAWLLVPAAWRRRDDAAGALALALLASAITLEASFLLISIASDLRYHLWSMAASALALILIADNLAMKRSAWIAATMLLGLVIAGGLFTRATLPRAPDTYQGMIHAPSG
jgi:hypothetical protein